MACRYSVWCLQHGMKWQNMIQQLAACSSRPGKHGGGLSRMMVKSAVFAMWKHNSAYSGRTSPLLLCLAPDRKSRKSTRCCKAGIATVDVCDAAIQPGPSLFCGRMNIQVKFVGWHNDTLDVSFYFSLVQTHTKISRYFHSASSVIFRAVLMLEVIEFALFSAIRSAIESSMASIIFGETI